MEIARAKTIIDNLLKFSKNNENSVKNNLNLNQIINQTLELIKYNVPKKINFKLLLNHNIHEINGNYEDIQCCVINLIKNSYESILEKNIDFGVIKIETNLEQISKKHKSKYKIRSLCLH